MCVMGWAEVGAVVAGLMAQAVPAQKVWGS